MQVNKPVNILVIYPKIQDEIDHLLLGFRPVVDVVVSAGRTQSDATSIDPSVIHFILSILYRELEKRE